MAGTLHLTRGLPASGKTTRAREWVADKGGLFRLNRDDFRVMMFGGWTGLAAHEDAVTVAQHAAVSALLAAGYDVVCDDTNLAAVAMEAWSQLVAEAGAELVVWDMTDVPLDVCLDRNEGRAGTAAYVRPTVIRYMADRYLGDATEAHCG